MVLEWSEVCVCGMAFKDRLVGTFSEERVRQCREETAAERLEQGRGRPNDVMPWKLEKEIARSLQTTVGIRGGKTERHVSESNLRNLTWGRSLAPVLKTDCSCDWRKWLAEGSMHEYRFRVHLVLGPGPGKILVASRTESKGYDVNYVF